MVSHIVALPFSPLTVSFSQLVSPQLGLMERKVLEQIPQFQELLEAMRKADIADLVWAVIGGNPAHYHSINRKWKRGNGDDIVQVVEKYLIEELVKSTRVLREVQQAHPMLKQHVYSRFVDADSLPESITGEYKLPSPDKVLRLAKSADNKSVLVPSTPAMALALRYSKKGEPPSLDQVRQALPRGNSLDESKA